MSLTKEDFEYLADVPSGANVRYKLEGYLFPATYDITKNTKPIDIVNMMLNAFDMYYTGELKSLALEKGYNSFQVLTVASMIEREAKIDEERPKIASVIYNRLEENTQLQIDSTILYPMTEGMYDKPKLMEGELDYSSPYNTYVSSGLPVGPICNPGLACIKAALQPADTNYMYYHIIDEEKGEHIFTETLEEHEDTLLDDDQSDDEE